MNERIAFLGLGVMGGYMAANLAKEGYLVKGWNRTPDRPGVAIATDGGVEVVSSLEEAVKGADVVFVCVGDVPDVEEVILSKEGVAEYAVSGTLVVDMSTIGTEAAKRIGTALKAKDMHFLDAPVSGGDVGAKQGVLTIMVGGEEEDFVQCQPLFAAMGKNIRLCGPVGSGQAVKMCNQVLGAVHMVALCEAMQLAQKLGIDPNLIIEVCSTGAASSWALSNLGEKIIQQDYQPGFAIAHMLKDLRLVKESGAVKDLPGVEIAERLFKIVEELDGDGGKEQGTQAMIRAYLET